MAKGKPKRDGSGGGTRGNQGRGGCSPTRSTGQGSGTSSGRGGSGSASSSGSKTGK